MTHCRKNQSTMTAAEKSRFVAAVIELKSRGIYDNYVNDHSSFMAGAHRGPAFFPWHREFLRRFELDLRAIDSSVTLPYWDWTVDNSTSSSIWDASFMGGNGRPSDGQVLTGPFAFSTGNWNCVGTPNFLRRRLGASGSAPTLPTAAELTNALAVTPYDVSPYNDGSSLGGFRNRLEGWFNGPQLHNKVHVWVGGSMGPATSPNDPVFFLHHCFIDKLWFDWQTAHPGAGYLPIAGAAAGHNLNDAMEPWAGRGTTVRPADVLDHHALGYAYDTEGLCRPTIKFLDDGIKYKFLDDPITLKFNDDIATLPSSDAPQTLKFFDDPLPTLKFRDDGPSLKFSDDIGTSKNFDDVKQPGLDKNPIAEVKMPGLDKQVGSDLGSNPIEQLGNPAPFILSTPHHSMAWAQTFPEAHKARLEQVEKMLGQAQQQVVEINAAQEKGLITEKDLPALQRFQQELQHLMAEHSQLTKGV